MPIESHKEVMTSQLSSNRLEAWVPQIRWLYYHRPSQGRWSNFIRLRYIIYVIHHIRNSLKSLFFFLQSDNGLVWRDVQSKLGNDFPLTVIPQTGPLAPLDLMCGYTHNPPDSTLNLLRLYLLRRRAQSNPPQKTKTKKTIRIQDLNLYPFACLLPSVWFVLARIRTSTDLIIVD